MELNSENKAKFFSQYWGQKLFCLDYDGTVMVYVNDFIKPTSSGHYKESYLTLKSISSISDVDAREIANICCHKLSKGSVNRRKDKGICYFGEDGDYLYLYQSFYKLVLEGKRFTDTSINNYPIQVIDYLRSQGYALPWASFSVEKMIESGWIKLI